MVGEHSIDVEDIGTTGVGDYGKANVGISNDKGSEKLPRRKTKVS